MNCTLKCVGTRRRGKSTLVGRPNTETAVIDAASTRSKRQKDDETNVVVDQGIESYSESELAGIHGVGIRRRGKCTLVGRPNPDTENATVGNVGGKRRRCSTTSSSESSDSLDSELPDKKKRKTGKSPRKQCGVGIRCADFSNSHRRKQSHPRDPDWTPLFDDHPKATKNCIYKMQCGRTNERHFRKYRPRYDEE